MRMWGRECRAGVWVLPQLTPGKVAHPSGARRQHATLTWCQTWVLAVCRGTACLVSHPRGSPLAIGSMHPVDLRPSSFYSGGWFTLTTYPRHCTTDPGSSTCSVPFPGPVCIVPPPRFMHTMARRSPFAVGQVTAVLHHGLGPTAVACLVKKVGQHACLRAGRVRHEDHGRGRRGIQCQRRVMTCSVQTTSRKPGFNRQVGAGCVFRVSRPVFRCK